MPFKPDRVNIHELTIEEPEKQAELPFDPERDITEEDWRKMKGRIDVDEWSDGPTDKAMEIRILDPKYDLKIKKWHWQEMKSSFTDLD